MTTLEERIMRELSAEMDAVPPKAGAGLPNLRRRPRRRHVLVAAAAATVVLVGGLLLLNATLVSGETSVAAGGQHTVSLTNGPELRVQPESQETPSGHFLYRGHRSEVELAFKPAGLERGLGEFPIAGPAVDELTTSAIGPIVALGNRNSEPILVFAVPSLNGPLEGLIGRVFRQTLLCVAWDGSRDCSPANRDGTTLRYLPERNDRGAQTATIVWLGVPDDTAVVTLTTSTGIETWQRPVGSSVLFEMGVSGEGTFRVQALASDGDVLSTESGNVLVMCCDAVPRVPPTTQGS